MKGSVKGHFRQWANTAREQSCRGVRKHSLFRNPLETLEWTTSSAGGREEQQNKNGRVHGDRAKALSKLNHARQSGTCRMRQLVEKLLQQCKRRSHGCEVRDGDEDTAKQHSGGRVHLITNWARGVSEEMKWTSEYLDEPLRHEGAPKETQCSWNERAHVPENERRSGHTACTEGEEPGRRRVLMAAAGISRLCTDMS